MVQCNRHVSAEPFKIWCCQVFDKMSSIRAMDNNNKQNHNKQQPQQQQQKQQQQQQHQQQQREQLALLGRLPYGSIQFACNPTQRKSWKHVWLFSCLELSETSPCCRGSVVICAVSERKVLHPGKPMRFSQ
ncbi:unnamed protein product [Polarella glacialis]|uniref:Uncharacterized protein n=1 Tax=Polarella glacialis TaxID=89957 RepID=A0A813GWK5_POLGL|nr:unnamed protein product [Polarella glacialis]